MYQMDIEAGFTSPKHCRSVAFSLVKYGAPEGTRTPNLLLRSRKAWFRHRLGCPAGSAWGWPPWLGACTGFPVSAPLLGPEAASASPSAISPSWTASYQALPRRCGTPTTNRAQPRRDNQLGSSSTVTAELVC